MQMERLYSFVDTMQKAPEKNSELEKIISDILKHTITCSIFVREYCGHGFGGEKVCFLE